MNRTICGEVDCEGCIFKYRNGFDDCFRERDRKLTKYKQLMEMLKQEITHARSLKSDYVQHIETDVLQECLNVIFAYSMLLEEEENNA